MILCHPTFKVQRINFWLSLYYLWNQQVSFCEPAFLPH